MTEPAEPLTNAQLVAFFGRELFGSEWGSAMARLTDVNQRTISRIKVAADEGRDYPAAKGVLAALRDALTWYTAEVTRVAPQDQRQAAQEPAQGR